MNENSAQVIRVKIIARLVAGFIEDFVSRLSYRTLVRADKTDFRAVSLIPLTPGGALFSRFLLQV